MPDRDVVHPGLPRAYQRAYKQLCEGALDGATLARSALRGLLRELRRFGDDPICLMRQLADLCKDLPDGGLFADDPRWAKLSQAMDDFAQSYLGNQEVLKLAMEACHGHMEEVRHRVRATSEDFYANAVQLYVRNVYRSRFESHMMRFQHHANASQRAVNQGLAEMAPEVLRGTASLAAQISRQGTIRNLRMPSRSQRPPLVDLDEDLTRGAS